MGGDRSSSKSTWFVIMIGTWIAFGALAAWSPGTLDDIWQWIRDLPTWGEVVAWILGLPWVIGLAIRDSSWDGWVRTTSIWVVAIGWILVSAPRSRKSPRVQIKGAVS